MLPGLACHPHRPFVVASTSRDSTVRLWSMAALAHPISLSILAQRPHDEIFAKNTGMPLPVKYIMHSNGLLVVLHNDRYINCHNVSS